MAGKSKRDQCFADAIDAYNDAAPKSQRIDLDSQRPWGIGDDGKWYPLGRLERLWDWISDSDRVYRIPDWTLTIDGTPVAGDNKFSGDRFSNRKGRSGNTQLEDQNQMNEDHSPGKEEYQDLNLNPDPTSEDNPGGCNCDEDPQPQEVPSPVLAPVSDPFANPAPGSSLENLPNPIPGGATAPAGGVTPPVETPVGGGGLIEVFP